MRTSLVSSVFFSVFSAMLFFKKISILCAAVQSKKLLLRRGAVASEGNPANLDPTHAGNPDVYRPLGRLPIPPANPRKFVLIPLRLISDDIPVYLDIELGYFDDRYSYFLASQLRESDATVWLTGGKYWLNNDVNRDFLQDHPNLNWGLSVDARRELEERLGS